MWVQGGERRLPHGQHLGCTGRLNRTRPFSLLPHSKLSHIIGEVGFDLICRSKSIAICPDGRLFDTPRNGLDDWGRSGERTSRDGEDIPSRNRSARGAFDALRVISSMFVPREVAHARCPHIGTDGLMEDTADSQGYNIEQH